MYRRLSAGIVGVTAAAVVLAPTSAAFEQTEPIVVATSHTRPEPGLLRATYALTMQYRADPESLQLLTPVLRPLAAATDTAERAATQRAADRAAAAAQAAAEQVAAEQAAEEAAAQAAAEQVAAEEAAAAQAAAAREAQQPQQPPKTEKAAPPKSPTPAPAPAKKSAAATAVTEAPVKRSTASRLIIGGWSRKITAGPATQATVDKCLLVRWFGPMPGQPGDGTTLLAGHNYCGYSKFSSLKTGQTVTVATGSGDLIYRVYGRKWVNHQGGPPGKGWIQGDMTLQTCEGSGTVFVWLDRIN